jgi:hypothetical protein
MPTSLNEVYKAIGTLTAEVAALRRDILDSENRAADNTRKADQSRGAIHRRMDELVTDVGTLKTDVLGMKRDIRDTKEVTDEVRRWKLMGLGALGVTGLAASAVTALLVKYWTAITTWFRGLG